jgi:hypothetical protein
LLISALWSTLPTTTSGCCFFFHGEEAILSSSRTTKGAGRRQELGQEINFERLSLVLVSASCYWVGIGNSVDEGSILGGSGGVEK